MRRFTPALLGRLKLLSFASLVLFASSALAQAVVTVTTAPSASRDWHSIFMMVIQGALALLLTTVVPTLLVPLLPKIPALTQHLLTWAQSQAAGVKSAYAQGVLNRLIALAGQKVLALENTEVAYLQQQLSSGTITPSQLPALLAGVKQKAVDAVKADAAAQGLWSMALGVFLGDNAGLNNWLGDVIESHVAQLPSATSSSAKVAPSTPVASTTSALKSVAPVVPPVAAP